MHKLSSVQLTASFSLETMEAKSQWDDIFKVFKEKSFFKQRMRYIIHYV